MENTEELNESTTGEETIAEENTTQEHTEDSTQEQAPSSYQLKYQDNDIDLSVAEMQQIAQHFLNQEPEISKYQKERESYNQRMEALKSDPFSAYQEHFGVDLNQMIQERMDREKELAELDPMERKMYHSEQELAEAREKLAQYDQEQQEQIAQQEQEEQNRQIDEAEQQIDQQISTLLENNPHLPNSPETSKRIANMVYIGLQSGVDLDPDDLVDIVKQDYHTEFQGMASHMSGEELHSMLGEDVCKKLREFELSKIPDPGYTSVAANAPAAAPVSAQAAGNHFVTEQQLAEAKERRLQS